ncbi:LytTR family transcriptional regulator DNA-binding domain-containing protein [Bacteroides caecimuris]|jgi:DNA-binding LytR/AlgR family response regulator|uniref:LytTR family transcriptional regulator DNA-binding domain-containing protein n=1 Tax=Bacteroides caecimuris TaxID=1796613 RepID=UPI0034E97EFD
MYKLCLNSRDELLIIDLTKIAFLQSNGNYTNMQYIKGETHLLTIGITKVEEYIRQVWPADQPSPFIRLGRRLLINQTYLTEINMLKQRITLSDRETNCYTLAVPKPLLKQYKELIYENFKKLH